MHWQTARSYCLVVCEPRWTEFTGQRSPLGVIYKKYRTLKSCQDYCITVSTCVAVDFNFLDNSCWLHLNPDHLSKTLKDFVTDQFRLNRTCPTTASGRPPI